MPLLPTLASAAACLVRIITNPPLSLLKIHPVVAPIDLRDADNSSSVARHRSASEFLQDPPSPTPPIELQILSSIPSPPSSQPPPQLEVNSTGSTVSATTSASSTYRRLSPRKRRELSEQVWREY
ncbi:hypothetical protein FVEN_g12844 [Fusarium venenatum]|uniref:Uncharacterized protein n=1 Tax=Fusarium venenatum TaxID=56646 RepID=A0A2L2TA31_9HYPO|nr:uncharacterized protein FVRRES_05603 [Fusarium venenatum]KAG8356206.1 hypothetical protein FVEN_g12844 [Fusarium venenatum]CEI61167.1 unnamed protein product [Fusarium venenatum]